MDRIKVSNEELEKQLQIIQPLGVSFKSSVILKLFNSDSLGSLDGILYRYINDNKNKIINLNFLSVHTIEKEIEFEQIDTSKNKTGLIKQSYHSFVNKALKEKKEEDKKQKIENLKKERVKVLRRKLAMINATAELFYIGETEISLTDLGHIYFDNKTNIVKCLISSRK